MRTLLHRRAPEGGSGLSSSITWNGKNDAGEAVATGIYFLHLVSGDERRTSKVVLLR